MNNTNKNYAKTLNKRLKGWDDAGVESNLVLEVREELEMFYDKYNIDAPSDYFVTNLDLTESQEEEYERIMDSFGDKAGSNINEMRKVYEENADRYQVDYHVNSFEDFVKFTDKMKNASDNALLKEVLSSSQIAELYTIASDINMNEYAVNSMIYQQYQKYGQTGDTLYNTILGYLNEDTSTNGWD
jgi:hypothetical protein